MKQEKNITNQLRLDTNKKKIEDHQILISIKNAKVFLSITHSLAKEYLSRLTLKKTDSILII
jgi:hypothetical protein